MPEGTVCADPCDGQYEGYETWQSDYATCECDHDTGRCAFDARKMNRCILRVRTGFSKF